MYTSCQNLVSSLISSNNTPTYFELARNNAVFTPVNSLRRDLSKFYTREIWRSIPIPGKTDGLPWPSSTTEWSSYSSLVVDIVRGKVGPRCHDVLDGAIFLMKVAVFGGFTYLLYRAIKAYRNADEAIENSTDRNSRLIASWLCGRKLDRTVFLPVAPGGVDGKLVWSSGYNGLTLVDGERKTTQPICVTNGLVSYKFTRWRMDSQRRGHFVTITLTPLSLWTTDVEPLRDHRSLIQGNWVVRREVHDGTAKFALARIGDYESAVIGHVEEAALHATMNVHGAKTQPYSVTTCLRSTNASAWKDNEKTQVAGALLADFWSEHWPYTLAQVTKRPAQALQSVTDTRNDVNWPYKPTGTRVGPDLCMYVDSAPMLGPSNELVAVTGRLDEVRNPIQSLTPEYVEFAKEFVSLVAHGHERTVDPMSIDYVIEKQDGPLQKARNQAARCWVSLMKPVIQVRAMLKKEAIANSGIARNVSTLRPEVNLRLGRYTLAMAGQLKKSTSWYCAGVVPPEVARRVITLTEGRQRVMAADISKMDACKNAAITTELLHRLHVRLLTGDHSEITALNYAEMVCSAKTDSGIPYAAAGSQLSGSATTTLHNTVVNAWICYCAHRKEGMDPELAYKNTNLGLFVGDDSLSLNERNSLEIVARELGYKIKAEIIPRGNEVPFLSRYFPNPWDGEAGSYQDVVRLMRKAHISFGDPNLGEQQLACNKWKGLHELDPAMSIYAAGLRAMERITNGKGMITEADTPWFVRESGGSWPQINDADSYFAMRSNVQPVDWCEWFEKIGTWTEYMAGPPMLIQNKNEVKYHTIDPTSAFTLPAPLPEENIPPPQTATAGTMTDVTNQRKEVEQRAKNNAERLRGVNREERQLRANKVVKGPTPRRRAHSTGTTFSSPTSTTGSTTSNSTGRRAERRAARQRTKEFIQWHQKTPPPQPKAILPPAPQSPPLVTLTFPTPESSRDN